MKNKMSDVRDHLVAMMESLNGGECDHASVERAKAMSMVASQYIAAVKTEIDALRLADEIGRLPQAVDSGAALEHRPPLRAIAGR